MLSYLLKTSNSITVNSLEPYGSGKYSKKNWKQSYHYMRGNTYGTNYYG